MSRDPAGRGKEKMPRYEGKQVGLLETRPDGHLSHASDIN